MTAIKCEICDLTYADNDISDVVNHSDRCKKFSSAIKELGFKPMTYYERESLKRQGNVLFYEGNHLEKVEGMNMIIRARYERELSKAIKGDFLWDMPPYLTFFVKEANELIKQSA